MGSSRFGLRCSQKAGVQTSDSYDLCLGFVLLAPQMGLELDLGLTSDSYDLCLGFVLLAPQMGLELDLGLVWILTPASVLVS
ncbi:hypothetical protein COCNU_scaffold000454G000010 [Cocos nucifera]|nr:hypothetical protein [Cocos nucifera]